MIGVALVLRTSTYYIVAVRSDLTASADAVDGVLATSMAYLSRRIVATQLLRRLKSYLLACKRLRSG